MFDMFELVRKAQGGAAFENLARAYGMTPEQMRATTAALTPAFAQGFHRQSQSDSAARRLTELMGADAYARAFEAQAAALDPRAKSAGEDALGALFGSKDVSRAVAAQAAAASGVQAEMIRKVLPVLTSVLIGGVIKATQASYAGSTDAKDGPFPGPFGAFWNELLREPGRRPESETAADAGPRNPFEEWANAFSGREPGKAQPDQPQAEPAPVNPLGDMMAGMLTGMFGPRPVEDPQATSAEPDRPPEAPHAAPQHPQPDDSAPGTPFGHIVESGRELSAQNARAMEQIFDAFFGDAASGGPRKPPA